MMKKQCPSCKRTHTKKNGHTHNGKQNHYCHACGRQFVEKPEQILISLLVHAGEPFSAQKTAELIKELDRQGYVYIPNVLTLEEVENLKEPFDQFADPNNFDTDNLYSDWIGVRLFERDRMFRDMLVREPIISLVEAICGKDCHLIADGAVRNQPGKAISNFHVDDTVFFPLPDNIRRHDSGLPLPVFQLTVQMPLTDIPSPEYGPTQFVPGSHYSGRLPNHHENPRFEGEGPVSILCKAGDIYIQNGQCWHRGAPNTSDRTRYLYQIAYGPRWVSQRLYPFLNYRMPDHVLEGASERLLRVLGKHPKGAYG
jgi:hypothetical protein